jgi:hypothetical protein
MKPFKVVWLKTETLEAELDHIKGSEDMKKFMSSVSPDSVINTVEGAYRLYKWDGENYIPYHG